MSETILPYSSVAVQVIVVFPVPVALTFPLLSTVATEVFDEEYLAKEKCDIILLPGYQRGEATDILRAQTKMIAFRCNSVVAKSSYSMNSDEKGGRSMIVAPNGKILIDLGKEIGSVSVEIDPFEKFTRTAGFGGGIIRNDDFINDGLRPEIFKNR